MKPRLIICDPHELEAHGLALLLDADFEILHVTHRLQSLSHDVKTWQPDAVLQALSDHVKEGLDLLTQIRAHFPTVRIVVVTQWEDPEIAAEAFRRGASAYVVKSSEVAELIEAVRTALAGRTYVTARHAGALLHALAEPPRPNVSLTSRQLAVLQQLAGGKTMKEVASSLKLTPRTVAFHKYRIMRTLNIKTSAELVRFAVERGLV